VQTIEWLGAEAYAFGTVQGLEIGLRLPADRAQPTTLPRTGEVLHLGMQPDSWHLFDPETGLNLSLPDAG